MMPKMPQGKRGGMTHPSGNVAVPSDAQLRLAETRKRLAVARYKIGVRQGAAWLNPDHKNDHAKSF